MAQACENVISTTSIKNRRSAIGPQGSEKENQRYRPANLYVSFHNAFIRTNALDVIRIMASQLTLLFGPGRISYARTRCQIATIQCATTNSRASVRGFVITMPGGHLARPYVSWQSAHFEHDTVSYCAATRSGTVQAPRRVAN